jgi:hypothetical protein
VQGWLAGEFAAADLVGEPQREPHGFGPPGAGQQEHEFVAAVAEQRVAAAHHVPYPLGELAEHLVAAQVPVRVVDGLEEVDVEQEERARAGGAGGPRQLFGHAGLKEGTRVRPGDRVGDGPGQPLTVVVHRVCHGSFSYRRGRHPRGRQGGAGSEGYLRMILRCPPVAVRPAGTVDPRFS